ncbi:MAG: excinuclease ABC subunit UvrC [Coxiellaceae bacterium]|nr:excinuclease ABC subunit UvrC [Coxiellaceae bacterium]
MNQLQNLPNKPGVYRFFDNHQKIIYVGKAKDLKKRVSQYFQKKTQDKKTAALVEKIADIQITITENENQALLLELNLIKAHRPKYNILLRDDKSYPFLFLSEEAFPRLDYHRGARKEKGRYFGPYPNAGSVRDNLALIQKLFQLRQCSSIFFKNRSRPCLQYQIGRCTAPCVNYVSKENYQLQVKDAIDFLSGKNKTVMASIENRMIEASEKMNYENAAHLRDLLIRLRKLQAQQFVIGEKGNIDIFGLAEKLGEMCIAVVSVRHGNLLGHKTFFPRLPENSTREEVLSAFIPQYYCNTLRGHDSVDWIVSNEKIADRAWIEKCLQEQWQSKVSITARQMPAFREWQSIALNNAEQALLQHQSDKNQLIEKWESFQTMLGLPNKPERVECFDISHTMGEATKASCVVFGEQGAIKKLYRQFTIENITPGDDYAAMTQALTRRYTHLKMHNLSLPDVIIIDGGKGQLTMAIEVMESLQISGVILLGVAKGPTRKAGLEKIILDNKAIELPQESPARFLIQQIRDEAHRFAITAHRKMRGKNRLQSVLDTIAGVGGERKKALLHYFGGLSELKKASAAEISKVKGVSRDLAKRIYDALR